MADLVDVVIEDERWANFGLDGLAQRACAAVLVDLAFDPAKFEISLLGCNDTRIAALNTEFLEKSGPTNVLSWPDQVLGTSAPGYTPARPRYDMEPPNMLGDIAIAYGVCARQAELAHKPQDQHVLHLLVHATLHLLGYDHIVKKDAVLMEEIECRTLATLGCPDPYKHQ